MFTMVLWSNDVYATSPSGGGVAPTVATAPIIGDRLDDVIRWLVLVLSAPVIWLLAEPLASNAWQELRRGVAAVDLLLVLGVGAAFSTRWYRSYAGTGTCISKSLASCWCW